MAARLDPSILLKSDPTPEQRRQAETLVTAVVAAYLLTTSEIADLAALILTARLAALTAAYEDAASSAGADLPEDWQPPDSVTQAQRDAADANAASIAATYRQDAIATATAFMLHWLAQHGDDADPLAGARSALTRHLSAWADERAVWKAAQVAQYETSSAAHAGTLAAVDDLESGDLTDDTGAPIDYSQLTVAVLPESSSSDFCADYAGNVYAFDDAPSLDFPAHISCVHFVVVLAPDGSEVDI